MTSTAPPVPNRDTPILSGPEEAAPVPIPRALLGGFLMGLANLVPGISGGTMILAIGLYDRFIAAVADVSRLRLRRASLVFLGAIVIGLASAVLLGSGVAVRLVSEHRWAMYALFVGMTLGGAPELLKQARPFTPGAWVCLVVGFGVMAWFAFQSGETVLEPTLPVLVAVGAAGAASMILPGISGSYVLLILGMYDTVVGSLSISEVRAAPMESLRIIAPVGVGALLGIALLSNVLKSLLAKHPRSSHGALLGLLLGSVLGLYPFQASVHPELSHRPTRKAIEAVVLQGEAAADASSRVSGLELAEFTRHVEKWDGMTKGDMKRASLLTARFTPTTGRVLSALGLFILGVLATRLLGRKGA